MELTSPKPPLPRRCRVPSAFVQMATSDWCNIQRALSERARNSDQEAMDFVRLLSHCSACTLKLFTAPTGSKASVHSVEFEGYDRGGVTRSATS